MVNYKIYNDFSRVTQVLFNLIQNSIASVEMNKGKISICFEGLEKDFQSNVILARVTDNGPGIPKS